MKHHDTWCAFQIGDSLIHLHFLRKLALRHPEDQFTHYVNPVHFPQMIEVIEDLPNVHLGDVAQRPSGAHHIWKNHEKYWEHHALRDQYAEFHLEWFRHLSRRMGVESPFRVVEDLLFDYPALLKPTPLSFPFDVLFVNSAPCSAQFRAYLSGPGGCNNPDYFTPLIAALAERHRVVTTWPSSVRVPCTWDFGISCTGIGNLSLFCKYLVFVSTGPSWPTFNVWNHHTAKLRLAFLDREKIGMAPNTREVQCLSGAFEVLRQHEIL